MPKNFSKYRSIKKILIKILFVVLLYFIVMNYFMLDIKNKKDNKNFQTILTKNISDFSKNKKVYIYNKLFFIVTKDGITLYDISGNIKWNYTLNISYEPIVVESSNNLCIAEYKGKKLYVFNLEGLWYEKKFDYPILSFSVNNKGYCSVILENKNYYTIYVHDEKGNIITKSEIKEKNNFPIAASISNDNKILAVSFLDINNFPISSKILFYYIKQNNETEEFLDNMYGSILNLEDQIMAKIKFINNNTLIGISDREIIAIETSKNNCIKTKWKEEFLDKIKYTNFVNDKFICTIFEENTNNLHNNIKFYNLYGDVVGQYDIKENISFVRNNFNNIIIKKSNSNKKAYAINYKGKLLWKYNDIQDIEYINFIENNKILVITSKDIRILLVY